MQVDRFPKNYCLQLSPMSSDIAKRQRTVPSTKVYDFVWRRPVPAALQAGAYFDRYDEVRWKFSIFAYLSCVEVNHAQHVFI